MRALQMCIRDRSVEELGKPSWSSTKRALITFENEHDESLNVEIPISKWVFDSCLLYTSRCV